jgi:hypothetical protein
MVKCVRPSNMFCLLKKTCWSVVEAILKYYWRVFNVVVKKSPKRIIFQIRFQLITWKITIRTAHLRLILKVQKPGEVPLPTLEISIDRSLTSKFQCAFMKYAAENSFHTISPAMAGGFLGVRTGPHNILDTLRNSPRFFSP